MLCQDGSGSRSPEPYTRQIVQQKAHRAARRASLMHVGVHILRHTFCSHLAMRGAPVRAIQELAGHKELTMTQRYMHLSPAALDAAIKLLDDPIPGSQGAFGDQNRGDIVETTDASARKSFGIS